MKVIIIYKSKTGFTKKYAKWIQEALHCDLTEMGNATQAMLTQYDRILFGSYVRIEKVRGIQKILQLAKGHEEKLIFFATGATSHTEKVHIEKLWQNSVENKVLAKTPHFYLESGLNYEKMSLPEKILMKLFSLLMKKKGKTTGESYDNSSKEFIVPLVDYVKKQV